MMNLNHQSRIGQKREEVCLRPITSVAMVKFSAVLRSLPSDCCQFFSVFVLSFYLSLFLDDAHVKTDVNKVQPEPHPLFLLCSLKHFTCSIFLGNIHLPDLQMRTAKNYSLS